MPDNDHPLISVILPTYNRADHLNSSIDSVIGQTHTDFELIIVDDGSSDSTLEVVSAYKDPRIRYLKLERNCGLSAARNAGLDCAKGAYLAFQDSDDEWYLNKLEIGLKAIESHSNATVVYGDMVRRLKNGHEDYLRSPEIRRGRLVNPETRFWQSYMLAMQPCLIRRDHLASLRFDEDLHFFEDLDFHLSLALNHEYVHVPEPLVIYNESDGLTADQSREPVARRYLLKKYAATLGQQSPGFIVRENINILLRRSLMPIVRKHLVPM